MKRASLALSCLLAATVVGCASGSWSGRAKLAEWEAQAAQRRAEYVAARPTLAPGVRQAITDGAIVVGMTEEDVRVACGEPARVNRSFGPGGAVVQMVYETPGGRTCYAHLHDGVVKEYGALGDR